MHIWSFWPVLISIFFFGILRAAAYATDEDEVEASFMHWSWYFLMDDVG